MLLALLRDDDLQPALLRQLTVAEAGHALAAVCRSARDAVRACKQWRPMWNREHAVARVRALKAKQRAQSTFNCGVGEPFYGALFSELESLARLLVDELLPAGVISLHFCLAGARAAQAHSARLPRAARAAALRVGRAPPRVGAA